MSPAAEETRQTTVRGLHEISYECSACQLPAPSRDGPCPHCSQGSRWLLRPHCASSFQVWLCLSVTSACLTGTRPSSGVQDGMGVCSNRLAQGWGVHRRWGRNCICQEWGEAGRKVYLLLSRLLPSSVRTVPSETGSCRLRHARGRGGPQIRRQDPTWNSI